MVDLSTREATDAEWDTLVQRSERDSIEQEPVEVWEMRGRAADRLGRRAEARRCLDHALGLAARIPNLLEPRIRGALAP